REGGEVAEEMGRGAPPPQQAGGGATPQRNLGRNLLAPLPLDYQVVEVLHPALAHRLGDSREAEDDAGLLLHDPRSPTGAIGNGRLSGYVSQSKALLKGRSHKLAQRIGVVHSRSVVQDEGCICPV